MQSYTVEVRRLDPYHARAEVRDFTLALGARRADPSAGFNPVETLLSAVGDCLLTSLAHVADGSRVAIEAASVEVEAMRQENPPLLTHIGYVLSIRSDAPDERLGHLVDLAKTHSTVLQTVSQAVSVEGTWRRA